MEYLTGADIDRQDCVDNAVQSLIEELARGHEINWDIENIAEVREALEAIIVDKLKLMNEFEFYPYLEIQKDGSETRPAEAEPKNDREKVIRLTIKDLEEALQDQIMQWDYDEIACIAGDWFGGICRWEDGDNFIFVPDDNYQGAFDYLEEETDEPAL